MWWGVAALAYDDVRHFVTDMAVAHVVSSKFDAASLSTLRRFGPLEIVKHQAVSGLLANMLWLVWRIRF